MAEFVDLHTHSTRSDGLDSVEELIRHAAETAGLRAITLCDHDVLPPKTVEIDGRTVDPVQYAKEKGFRLIPGIEISCDTDVDDVHIVGIFCDFDDPNLRRLEETVKTSKTASYKKLCDLMVERGMDVSWEYVLSSTGREPDDIQRKHIFESIAAKGYTPDWKSAKIMVRDDPVLNVKREKPDPLDAIDWIHGAGGVAILAHPFLIDDEVCCHGDRLTRAEYIERMLERGLDGMEADYPYYKTSYKGQKSVDEMAGFVYRTYGPRLKFLSGGSDYHADYKKNVANGRSLGDGRVPYHYFEKMILPYGK